MVLDFNEIVNVWANDTHFLTFIVAILYTPFLIVAILFTYKNRLAQSEKTFTLPMIFSFIRYYLVEFLFFLLFISWLFGFIGVFQFKFILIINIILRAVGIVILTVALFSFFILVYIYKLDNNSFFHKISRYPFYTLILLISISLFFTNINLITLIFSIFLNVCIFFRVREIEKKLILSDKSYIDKVASIPLLFPNIFRSLSFYIKKVFKKQ